MRIQFMEFKRSHEAKLSLWFDAAAFLHWFDISVLLNKIKKGE